MSDNGNISLPDKIRFLQYHKPDPRFKAGTYEIAVRQAIQIRDKTLNQDKTVDLTPIRKTFIVGGERQTVKPDDILAVFPPDGSLGDHSNVLPHLILKRSTLPWEQSAIAGDTDTPWLALLLFDESETVKIEMKAVKDLPDLPEFADYQPAVGQGEQDQVALIEVERTLLEKILPTVAELKLLAHVRLGIKDNQPVGGEQAVIIGNRLPRQGKVSMVHLVSIEGRYQADGTFNYSGAGSTVRLITLKNWRFACPEEGQGFKLLLSHINRTPGTLQLLGRQNAAVDSYLAQGYVAVPHTLRQGDKTVSWYHGPLSPVEPPQVDNPETQPLPAGLPALASDALLHFNPNTGMFDVAYSAAWELGRMLALRSKKFSVELYNWKRVHRQRHLDAIDQEQRLLLPLKTELNSADEAWPSLESWLISLNQLNDVPFNYLVPAEQMLPPESIRFFYLDPDWLTCLLDGALSIGRISQADHQYESESSLLARLARNRYPRASGFLLRSAVVSGWPGLLVEAYDQVVAVDDIHPAHQPLDVIRLVRLSEDVLLGLFSGDVKTVDFHLKPETLHFGFDAVDGGYEKQLRDAQGNQRAGEAVAVTWKEVNGQIQTGVVNITTLADDIKAKSVLIDAHITSAQFAMEMVEGIDKIRFTWGE